MKQYFILLLIILFASILRFYGISNNLPEVFHIDEPYIMDGAVEVADGKLRHGVILRGSLPYYVTGAAIKLSAFINPSILKGQKSIKEAYKIDKTPFYTIGRGISALYSIFEIIILFILGKLIFNNTIGLLATCILSVSTLSIQQSHIVMPNTALSVSILSTILLSVLGFKKNNYKLFFLSAAFVGISAAQKMPGVLVLPCLLLFLFSSRFFKSLQISQKIVVLLIMFFLIFLSYFLSYPFLPVDKNNLIHEWAWESNPKYALLGGSIPLPDIGIIGRLFKNIFEYLHYATGTIILTFAFFGGIILFIKKNIYGMFITIFIFIYLIGNSLNVQHWQQHILPLVPYISLFSSFFIREIIRKSKNNHHKIIFFLLLSVSLVIPTIKSVFLSISFKGNDTRLQVINWAKTNNVDESRILYDKEFNNISKKLDKELYSYDVLPDELLKFQYFITQPYYCNLLLKQKALDLKILRNYDYIYTKLSKVMILSPGITRLNINDFEFILSFPKWKIHQTTGNGFYIFKI